MVGDMMLILGISGIKIIEAKSGIVKYKESGFLFLIQFLASLFELRLWCTASLIAVLIFR